MDCRREKERENDKSDGKIENAIAGGSIGWRINVLWKKVLHSA